LWRRLSFGAGIVHLRVACHQNAFALACAGDVFVTSDVPLAVLAEKKAWVIDLHGDLIDYTTLQSRLHLN
jgi:uncharacterized protein YaiI (UPF0178 family)